MYCMACGRKLQEPFENCHGILYETSRQGAVLARDDATGRYMRSAPVKPPPGPDVVILRGR